MLPALCDSTDPVESVNLVVNALGDVFGDDSPFSDVMTARALDALGTCVAYLRDCLGPARTVAVSDTATVGTVMLALHIACVQLHAGVQAAPPDLDRRQWPADQTRIPIARGAALRAALAAAGDALSDAATRFGAAHAAATNPAPPPTTHAGRPSAHAGHRPSGSGS